MTKLKENSDTRDALIQSGIKLFGEYGINGTTTRMLSQESGANIASISYYFSSKEGLYEACLDYIAGRIQNYLKETYTDVGDILQKEIPTKHEAKKAIQSLVDTMITMFLGNEEPRAWTVLIVREQANPSPAFDIIYDAIIKRVQLDFTKMVACALDIEPKSDEAKIRTHAIFSQIIGFITDRECFLRHMGRKALKTDQIELIRHVIQDHVTLCLKSTKRVSA